MTRILLVGHDPEAEDFSEPGRPPGLTAGKIQAGIKFGWSRCAGEAGTSMSVSYGFKTQLRPSARGGAST